MGFFLSVCGGLFGLWLGSPGKKGVEPKVSFDSVCFCGFSACVVGKKDVDVLFVFGRRASGMLGKKPERTRNPDSSVARAFAVV
jgi:hypothetical protein